MDAKDWTDAQTLKKATVKDHVEVLYFHGKQRCATCMAIESNTNATMQKNFAEKMKKGKVVFKVMDISKNENEKMAEKYEVTWSAVYVRADFFIHPARYHTHHHLERRFQHVRHTEDNRNMRGTCTWAATARDRSVHAFGE